MSKFKVGDKVRILHWEDIEKNIKEKCSGTPTYSRTLDFDPIGTLPILYMARNIIGGHLATIKKISDADMIELELNISTINVRLQVTKNAFELISEPKEETIAKSNPDKTIVIINGSGGVGKDTFVKLISEKYKTINYSSIDYVKNVLSPIIGNAKSEKERKLMSDVKLALTEYNDLPFKKISECVNVFLNHSNAEILFLHIREPKEIERAAKEFNATTVLITNPNVKKINSNIADRDVDNYNYNFIIANDSTIERFKDKALKFIRVIHDTKTWEVNI